MQDVGCEAQDVGCRVWSVGSRGWDARDKEGVDKEEAFFGEPGSLPPGVVIRAQILSASSSRPQPLPPQQVRWARLGARHALNMKRFSENPEACHLVYRGYSKLRTHTAIGPYGRSMPRSIGGS